jgi:hypothetical protein
MQGSVCYDSMKARTMHTALLATRVDGSHFYCITIHTALLIQHYTGMAAATYVRIERAGEQRPKGLLTVSSNY